MIEAETIIVGGGPAGSAAAMELRRAGREVLILDKSDFPRVKLCAGWVTPKVFSLLKVSPEEYPHGIIKFDKLHYDFGKFRLPVKTVQYSVRRYEFDVWLHSLAGAPLEKHKVENIEFRNGYYVLDDKYKSRYLIGAGGTYCPVYRKFFAEINPRAIENKIVAIEEEFPYEWQDDRCLLWFGDLKLRGYAWYVPKANNHINIGLGGTYYGLRREGLNIKYYWKKFTEKLIALGLVENREFNGKGYSYFLRSNVAKIRRDNAFIVGDAVGLATLDMGEGIAPAIESGLLAARAIAYGENYSVAKIARYSFPAILFAKKYFFASE